MIKLFLYSFSVPLFFLCPPKPIRAKWDCFVILFALKRHHVASRHPPSLSLRRDFAPPTGGGLQKKQPPQLRVVGGSEQFGLKLCAYSAGKTDIIHNPPTISWRIYRPRKKTQTQTNRVLIPHQWNTHRHRLCYQKSHFIANDIFIALCHKIDYRTEQDSEKETHTAPDNKQVPQCMRKFHFTPQIKYHTN